MSETRLALDPAALHGLPGETVRVLEPVTEAAPAALLITALTIFGAAVGRERYVLADGAHHAPHLYAAIVGKTARARKGTSYRVARQVMQHADRGLFEERTFGGFGSGEALIEAVGGGDEEKDAADDGSRRTAPAARFASAGRRGRARPHLSRRRARRVHALTDPAAGLGRRRPLRHHPQEGSPARGAHIAILGHITEEELRARLRGLEIANGLGNRFLFCLVERSKRIPDGQGLDRDETERLGWKWRKRLEQARQIEAPLKRTREADELWHDFDHRLDDDRPGMLGSLLARAEAHVLRLSLIYALADGESAIDRPHLLAALAVWTYSERSAFAISGTPSATPSPISSSVGCARQRRRALPGRTSGTTSSRRTGARRAFSRLSISSRVATSPTASVRARASADGQPNAGTPLPPTEKTKLHERNRITPFPPFPPQGMQRHRRRHRKRDPASGRQWRGSFTASNIYK